jgi:hypothetical protein
MMTNPFYQAGQRVNGCASPESVAPANVQPSAIADPFGGGSSRSFPVDCLPPVAAAMTRAIAEAVRTSETLTGCCVLGILSSAVGAGLRVQSGPMRVTRGNLYISPGAESGSGKSETVRLAAKPMVEYEGELIENWRQHKQPVAEIERDMLVAEIKAFSKQCSCIDADISDREQIREVLLVKGARRRELEAELEMPILFVEDITGESLASLLETRGCLASISAEAGIVFENLLRYGKKCEGIYLKAWSGDQIRVNRQTLARVALDGPCLAALWLAQPDRLDSLFKKSDLRTGGFLPRLLACQTGAKARPITKSPVGISPDTANAWTQIVRELMQTFRGASQPFTLIPTIEAQYALDEHYNRIFERRENELRDIGPFAARWNEQAWRISVCLHAGVYGTEAGGHSLEVATAEKAIKLADWFAARQMEILKGEHVELSRPQFQQVLALLVHAPKGIRASDVYRKRIVSTADDAHSLLEGMEAKGELLSRTEKPSGGGHITRIYTKGRT